MTAYDFATKYMKFRKDSNLKIDIDFLFAFYTAMENSTYCNEKDIGDVDLNTMFYEAVPLLKIRDLLLSRHTLN